MNARTVTPPGQAADQGKGPPDHSKAHSAALGQASETILPAVWGIEHGHPRPAVQKPKRQDGLFAFAEAPVKGGWGVMSVYKLYTATVGDAAASVDIIKSGKIVGLQWAVVGDLDADGESYAAELSISSSSGLTTNDTKSSIATIRQMTALLTSGAVATGINQFMPLPDVPVSEGERLYLHTSGTSITATLYIWVDDGLDIAGRQRRLRL